jgi:hypothetical protein
VTGKERTDADMKQEEHYAETKTNGDGYITGQHTNAEIDNEDGDHDNSIRTV